MSTVSTGLRIRGSANDEGSPEQTDEPPTEDTGESEEGTADAGVPIPDIR